MFSHQRPALFRALGFAHLSVLMTMLSLASARTLRVLVLVLTLFGCSSTETNDRLLLLDPSALANARKAYRTAPAALPFAVREVIVEANGALAAPLVSVMDKEEVPPSGDKHDYMSLGPYWWPDLSKKDGLPYIRRDGEVNPESKKYGDNKRLDDMVERLQALALAYHITEEASFAEKAIAQVHRWFIAPETRMNPNLNYGQAIKGVVEGRGIGIIETYQLRYLLDALTLLSTSERWTPTLDTGMNAWLLDYLTWLQLSQYGKDEAGWKNNHGTAYDVQVSCLALYLGRVELAREVIGNVLQRRIATQVEPDGSQPFELERTKSWGYSNMNLGALVELAHLGRRVGVDLWNASTTDGRSIRGAVTFLLPYARGEKEWTWPLLEPMDPERLYYAVSMAAVALKDPVFAEMAREPAVARGHQTRRWFFVPVP